MAQFCYESQIAPFSIWGKFISKSENAPREYAHACSKNVTCNRARRTKVPYVSDIFLVEGWVALAVIKSLIEYEHLIEYNIKSVSFIMTHNAAD